MLHSMGRNKKERREEIGGPGGENIEGRSNLGDGNSKNPAAGAVPSR